ncbi:hypothetical protein ALP75_205412 [Pseudomonas syringae pv. actinidiae]|nr:hypothetical protein ALP75_205412 [Pseudomonas syringae pv. actinidiae]
MRVTNLCIAQFTGPKHHAFAHHHAYQQALGRHWQAGELSDKATLGRIEQVVVTLRDPAEHLAEVFQVIKRVVER